MRVAIIDLHGGESNTGIAAIQEILLAEKHSFHVFDARTKNEWPIITDWDVFISSGGPGDPSEFAAWSNGWKIFMRSLMEYNQESDAPKSAFLICLSFQLFCHHFELGLVSKRSKRSFGPYTCLLTPSGKKDNIFGLLNEIFQVADFRSYQITKPNSAKLEAMGAHILALEKDRPNIKHERALMAIQFSSKIYGTQFHPEVDGDSIQKELLEKPTKYTDKLGKKAYNKTLQKLKNITSLNQTHATILPQFLKQSEHNIKK